MTEQKITVYILRYVLTKGIIEKVSGVLSDSDGGIALNGPRNYGCISPHHYFLTMGRAVEEAEKIRAKKIAQLRKEILKLEAMTFTKDE